MHEEEPTHVDNHPAYQDLIDRNRELEVERGRHLRWQDKASMTIKEEKEEVCVAKQQTRAAKQQTKAVKKAALRAKTAAHRRITDLKRQVHASEQAKAQASSEHAQTIKTHENKLQDLQHEKEDGEKKAELAQQEQKNALQSEIDTLQSCIHDRDLEIARLTNKSKDDVETKRQAIRIKNKLLHTKVKAEGRLRKFRAGTEGLKSRIKAEEARAINAEGCRKGLEGQLKAEQTNAKTWYDACQQLEEDHKHEVLNAYEMTDFEEAMSAVPVEEKLSKKVSELQAEIDGLKAKNEEWRKNWVKAEKSKKDWEKEIRRQCEEEKHEALAQVPATDPATSQQDSEEQNIRRQCAAEMEKALAEQREQTRLQSSKSKLKSHSNQRNRNQVKKLQVKWVLGKAVSGAVALEQSSMQKKLEDQFQTEWLKHKTQLESEKAEEVKRVQGQCQTALSNYKTQLESEKAEEAKRVQGQYQTVLSDYKTQLESERLQSLAQSQGQNATSSINPTLPDPEITKRDDYIKTIEKTLKQAYDDKREIETDLKRVKSENEQVSQQVMAPGSNQPLPSTEPLATQTRSDAQVALMARDLAKAQDLLAETATMGGEDKYRQLLDGLVFANKTINDLRITIEEGKTVDYHDLEQQLTKIANAPDVDDIGLDANNLPTLNSQLFDMYRLMTRLNKVLEGSRGESTDRDLLERIYRDMNKGKGKAKAEPRIASGSASGTTRDRSRAPSPEANPNLSSTNTPNNNLQDTSGNNFAPSTMQPSQAYPSTQASSSSAPQPQNAPEEMDCATAHALQGLNEADQGILADIDFDSIDVDDPMWQQSDLTALDPNQSALDFNFDS